MKVNLVLIAMLMTTAVLAQSEIVSAPVKHLYVPQGFDSNDSVEVVVAGTFPSPCYARSKVSVEMNNDKVDIQITAIRRPPKDACPQMQVPFKEVVSLGNLQGGTYEVRVNNVLSEKLTVQEAISSAVDDHLYAAIDQLVKTGPNEYVIKGWRYSNCVVWDKVTVVSNGKDTLSVLPVMKQISTFCPMKGMPVSHEVKLDFSSLSFNEPLIHIRTMDGKSFNAVLGQE